MIKIRENDTDESLFERLTSSEASREVVEGIQKRAEGRKLLVTGTGRCGTVFASRVFGLPHESYFNLEPDLTRTLDSEVSCLAVPCLTWLDPDEWYVVHLVRHPQKVVGSLKVCLVNQKAVTWILYNYLTMDVVEYYERCIRRVDWYAPDEELRVEDLGRSNINSGGLVIFDQDERLRPYVERFGYEWLNKWGDPE